MAAGHHPVGHGGGSARLMDGVVNGSAAAMTVLVAGVERVEGLRCAVTLRRLARGGASS